MTGQRRDPRLLLLERNKVDKGEGERELEN